MAGPEDKALDVFCTALEMKSRKQALYEDAMKVCPDQVGIETFRMLRDGEADHLKRIQELYEQLKHGAVQPDACKYVEFETEDKKAILRRIAEQHGKMPKACLDDVVAIETGMQLEDASIQFFEDRLSRSEDAMEQEFLRGIIAEEREHYVLLADLKFYYVDPEAWFMEKSRARLDGAGGVA